MKRTKSHLFHKKSIFAITAASMALTACDYINAHLPTDHDPSDPTPSHISSSSNVVQSSSSTNVTMFETWKGTDGAEQIITGADAGSLTSGYWYTYSDDVDGGLSQIIWPVTPGNTYDMNSLEPIIVHCGGLCGTATLKKGNLLYKPFAAVAFDMAGSDIDGNIQTANASNMGGICISYASEKPINVEMGLGSDVDRQVDYANPFITLPKSPTGTTKSIPWSSFKQPTWYTGNYKISGEKAAETLASLRFIFQDVDGSNIKFNITEVGSYNNCTGIPASLEFSQSTPPSDTVSNPIQPQSSFETWFGANGEYQINTGFDTGSHTAGYWFTYGDDTDGGNSRIVWPTLPSNEYNDAASIIEYCGGFCGTAVLDKGNLMYNPFVGVGFNLAGEAFDPESHNHTLAEVDASDMGGICITYTSEIAPLIEMGLSSDAEALYQYALPAATLPKSTNGTTKYIPWSNFEQPSWYSGANKISGPEAAKQLVSLRIRMQASPGEYKFNIKAIGPYNGGSCTGAAN